MEDEDIEFAVVFRVLDKKLIIERIPKADFWKSLHIGQEFKTGWDNYILPLEDRPEPEYIGDVKPPQAPKPNAGWSFLID